MTDEVTTPPDTNPTSVVPPVDQGSIDTTSGNSGEPSRAEFQQLLSSIVGDKNAEITRLQRELESRQRTEAAAPKAEPVSYDQFVADPTSVMNKAVRDTVSELMAPLLQEVGILRSDRVFTSARDELILTDPNMARVFNDPALAAEIKNAFNTQNTKDAATLRGAASLIVGNHILRGNLLGGGNGNSTPNRSGDARLPNTPSIPSQSPPAPRVDSRPATTTLSDAEQKAARQLGWSDEQYLKMTNLVNNGGGTDIESIRGALK